VTPPARNGGNDGPPVQPLTTDDLRHKALAIREVATQEARRVLEDNTVRIVIASAVVCAVMLSAAYYMGTRAGRRGR
jgi:hypothetical protein